MVTTGGFLIQKIMSQIYESHSTWIIKKIHIYDEKRFAPWRPAVQRVFRHSEIIVEKAYGKTFFFNSMLLGNGHNRRFSDPKNHVLNIWISILSTISNQNNQRTMWYRVYPSAKIGGNDERSCSAAHASDTSRSLLSPFAPALVDSGQDRKKSTVESRQKTRGGKQSTTNSPCDKHFALLEK